MTQNSFPFFISFNRGRASLLPVGSWRILILMLYLDGALINSCKRISPSIKKRQEDSTITNNKPPDVQKDSRLRSFVLVFKIQSQHIMILITKSPLTSSDFTTVITSQEDVLLHLSCDYSIYPFSLAAVIMGFFSFLVEKRNRS